MNLEELEQIAATELETREKVKHEVRVCMAAGCLSCQSQGVKDALTAEIKNRGLEETHKVKGVGCMGLCSEGPLVATSDKQMYKHVTAADAGPLIESLDSPCGSDIPVRQSSVEPAGTG